MKYVKSIAVSLLLMLALTAGIAMGEDKTAATTVSATIPTILEITAPATVDLGEITKGSSAQQLISITYKSEAAGSIGYAVGNSGKMIRISDSQPLTNALQVLGSNVAFSSTTVSGSANAPASLAGERLDINLKQDVPSTEKGGSYQTDITWTVTATP